MNTKGFIFSDDALFHFTDRRTFLEEIIPSKVFLLNQLKNTNDPQEYKNYEFAPTTHLDLALVMKIEHEINDYYKNFVQIGCFCAKKKNDFSKTWLKPKIWSDFGDGHKGICLIFSNTALKSELKKIDNCNDIKEVTHNFKPLMLPTPDVISYSEIGSLKYCNQFVKDNIDIILQKDIDYEVENEYRCYAISENSNRIKFDLKKILRVLIIGERCPEIYNDVIKQHYENQDIKIYKNYFQPGIGYKLIRYN